MGQRYGKMEDQKPWFGLALHKDFGKEKWLKPFLKSANV